MPVLCFQWFSLSLQAKAFIIWNRDWNHEDIRKYHLARLWRIGHRCGVFHFITSADDHHHRHTIRHSHPSVGYSRVVAIWLSCCWPVAGRRMSQFVHEPNEQREPSSLLEWPSREWGRRQSTFFGSSSVVFGLPWLILALVCFLASPLWVFHGARCTSGWCAWHWHHSERR